MQEYNFLKGFSPCTKFRRVNIIQPSPNFIKCHPTGINVQLNSVLPKENGNLTREKFFHIYPKNSEFCEIC